MNKLTKIYHFTMRGLVPGDAQALRAKALRTITG
jgi:hypothetical protein